MNLAGNSQGPAVVEGSLAGSSPQGLIPSLCCEVVAHIDSGILFVGPTCPCVEVILSDFPGSGSVGAEDFLVDVVELGPLIVGPLGVKGIAVASGSDQVDKGVGVSGRSGNRFRVVGTGAGVGMVGTRVDSGYPGCRQQQDSVPVHPSKQFLNGRTGQCAGRMKERAGEVSVPV